MTRRSTPEIELMAIMVRGTPRLQSAACRGRTEWDAPDAPHGPQTRWAESRCLYACPDLDPCRAWVRGLTASSRRIVGVVVAGRYRPVPKALQTKENSA
jgi:hypothetical protein